MVNSVYLVVNTQSYLLNSIYNSPLCFVSTALGSENGFANANMCSPVPASGMWLFRGGDLKCTVLLPVPLKLV